MRKYRWIIVLAIAGVTGLGASIAIGAGGDSGNIRACVVKDTGQLRATDARGNCGPAQLTITISGDAFQKSSSGKTLTINGIPFKIADERPQTITINGVSFEAGRNKTITINGVAFEPQTGSARAHHR